jgi:protein-disulfide isomerase
MKRYGSVALSTFAVLAGLGWLAGAARAADDAATKKVIEYYRRKANVPPSANVEVKNLKDSPFKGAKAGTLSAGGREVAFTMSEDGKYAIFSDVEDLTADPFAGVMKKIDLKRKPAKGPENAKVTIVEYSDFQCPFCSRGYQTMESQVLKEYGDKVRFIYKNFPLPMHPWAEPAAIATECALDQKNTDAYWKLYHYFFENQRDLTAQNLKDKSLEAIKDTKIDAAKFTDCLDNKKTQDIVKKETAEGSSVGVSGTPAFIINGRLISGAQPFDAFKAVIDDELARAK